MTLRTPPASIDVSLWLLGLPISDVAFVAGAAFRLMAENQGISEAELFAEFARRAAADPDASARPE